MAFIEELDYASPTVLPLELVKKQLQLEADFIEDDALISIYVDAAITEAENYIHSEISEKKFRIDGKSFNDALSFDKQKINTIDSIKYLDAAGVLQTVDPANYTLESVNKHETKIAFVEGFEFPEVQEFKPNAVQVSVTVGYKEGKVPKAIVKALLLMVTNSYEFRTDTVKEKCNVSENALHKYRRY